MNPRGEANGQSKLTMWDVIAIRLLLEGGTPTGRVAKAFGVARRTIRSIELRLIWSWL